jgi:CubicO group peptidase (beta-lactamase class C family)
VNGDRVPGRVLGWCTPEFDGLRDALARNLSTGAELGAAICVVAGDEIVVDLWGGHRDRAAQLPWQEDTIVNLWSISKTVTALAALVLLDRGVLDLDDPVALHWPEFGAHGKEGVLVRHVLAHSTGVPGWEPPFTHAEMYDHDGAVARLASQKPWWEPGTASGYHAQNHGHLVGELVRRVTGGSLSNLVADAVTGPLRADFRFGAADVDPTRIAELVPPPPSRMPLPEGFDRGPTQKVFTAPPADATRAETPAWRAAELGAVNGHGNARSVARILSALSQGGTAAGVEVLSPVAAQLPLQVQTDGIDLVLGLPLRWGLGFALPSAAVPSIPAGRRCFWGGWGGSMGVVDPERELTVVYVMNRMGPDVLGSQRSAQYLDIVYESAPWMKEEAR